MKNYSYSDFLSALAGSKRLDILQLLLRAGSQDVTGIAKGVGMEQSAVSHNLRKLLACNFVHLETKGNRRIYSINDDTVVPLLRLIDRHIATYCGDQCPCCPPAANTCQPAKCRHQTAGQVCACA